MGKLYDLGVEIETAVDRAISAVSFSQEYDLMDLEDLANLIDDQRGLLADLSRQIDSILDEKQRA